MNPSPPWKFWHPLPFWHVLLVFTAAQIITTLPIVALRELAHLAIPEALAGGLGGLLGVLATRALVARRLTRSG